MDSKSPDLSKHVSTLGLPNCPDLFWPDGDSGDSAWLSAHIPRAGGDRGGEAKAEWVTLGSSNPLCRIFWAKPSVPLEKLWGPRGAVWRNLSRECRGQWGCPHCFPVLGQLSVHCCLGNTQAGRLEPQSPCRALWCSRSDFLEAAQLGSRRNDLQLLPQLTPVGGHRWGFEVFLEPHLPRPSA